MSGGQVSTPPLRVPPALVVPLQVDVAAELLLEPTRIHVVVKPHTGLIGQHPEGLNVVYDALHQVDAEAWAITKVGLGRLWGISKCFNDHHRYSERLWEGLWAMRDGHPGRCTAKGVGGAGSIALNDGQSRTTKNILFQTL